MKQQEPNDDGILSVGAAWAVTKQPDWMAIGHETLTELERIRTALIPWCEWAELSRQFVEYCVPRLTRYEISSDERLMLVHEFIAQAMQR